MSQAALITFEGPEGAGKSTQIRRVEAFLRGKGRACRLTREPGGTDLADGLRKLLLAHSQLSTETELLLMMAARADHVARVIQPCLAEGTTVICDRFVDSSLAYQGAGRGVDPGWIRRLNEFATCGVNPDLTILLDLPVEVGLERAARNGAPDRFEGQELAFHERLRRAYLDLALCEPDRIKLVQATLPAEEVSRQVLAIVEAFFEARS